jgi:hypothetical protein
MTDIDIFAIDEDDFDDELTDEELADLVAQLVDVRAEVVASGELLDEMAEQVEAMLGSGTLAALPALRAAVRTSLA